MSYEILYNKLFVKLPKTDKYIPMVLMGSNNCYEAYRRGFRGTERRSREFGTLDFYSGRKFACKKEDYLQKIIDYKNEEVARVTSPDYWDKKSNYTAESVEKQYGYFTSVAIYGKHTSTTSFRDFYNFFNSGFKNAKTIEELDKIGIHLVFYNYQYGSSNDKYSMPIPKFEVIKTEDQFYSELEKAENFIQNCIVKDSKGEEHPPYVYIHFCSQYDDIEYKMKRFFSKKREPKERKEVDKYYVLQNTDGYLVRYIKYGFKYSYFISGRTKKFATLEKADKFRLKLIEQNKHRAESWKVTEKLEKTFI